MDIYRDTLNRHDEEGLEGEVLSLRESRPLIQELCKLRFTLAEPSDRRRGVIVVINVRDIRREHLRGRSDPIEDVPGRGPRGGPVPLLQLPEDDLLVDADDDLDDAEDLLDLLLRDDLGRRGAQRLDVERLHELEHPDVRPLGVDDFLHYLLEDATFLLHFLGLWRRDIG